MWRWCWCYIRKRCKSKGSSIFIRGCNRFFLSIRWWFSSCTNCNNYVVYLEWLIGLSIFGIRFTRLSIMYTIIICQILAICIIYLWGYTSILSSHIKLYRSTLMLRCWFDTIPIKRPLINFKICSFGKYRYHKYHSSQ